MIPADFAKNWEAGWNSQDIDRILRHYASDVVFRSRKAIAITGKGEITGKPALKDYWSAALDRQPDLKFEVTQVYTGHDILVITYRNHHGVNAAETLRFDDHGIVVEASAAHFEAP